MMKITIISLLLTLLIGCSTTKSNSIAIQKNVIMEFTVTKIQNEMDGQTIFLKNDKKEKYKTIISPANGNFVELNVGDKISIKVESTIKSTPTQLISKNIRVMNN